MDIVDDEWRKVRDARASSARRLRHPRPATSSTAPPPPPLPRPLLYASMHMCGAQDALSHDEFDLPSTELDTDGDEMRLAPKRADTEKWSELCLDDFQNPRRRPTRRAAP